jgi:hypothetical protein
MFDLWHRVNRCGLASAIALIVANIMARFFMQRQYSWKVPSQFQARPTVTPGAIFVRAVGPLYSHARVMKSKFTSVALMDQTSLNLSTNAGR